MSDFDSYEILTDDALNSSKMNSQIEDNELFCTEIPESTFLNEDLKLDEKLEKEVALEIEAARQARSDILQMELNNFRNAVMQDIKADGKLDMSKHELEWMLDKLKDEALMLDLDRYVRDLSDEKFDEEKIEKDSIYSTQYKIEITEESINRFEDYLRDMQSRGIITEDTRYVISKQLFDDERDNYLNERDKNESLSPGTSSYDSLMSKIAGRKK